MPYTGTVGAVQELRENGRSDKRPTAAQRGLHHVPGPTERVADTHTPDKEGAHILVLRTSTMN